MDLLIDTSIMRDNGYSVPTSHQPSGTVASSVCYLLYAEIVTLGRNTRRLLRLIPPASSAFCSFRVRSRMNLCSDCSIAGATCVKKTFS